MSKRLENKLTYFIPQEERRKTILRIPESHSLHICPSSCGRRNAIRAYKNGEKEFISFLYISETDAGTGNYEQNIDKAISELMSVLTPQPKAFLLYFNCIDDFLGTDENALLTHLQQQFPQLRFTVCRIHPVSADEKISPGMRMHSQMYNLLEYSGKKEAQINLIGNYSSPDKNCELFSVLSAWGIKTIGQLFACNTFAEYQKLADSSLNLVLMPMGELAAKNMSTKLDIPYYINLISYDITEVLQDYQNIANLLGKPFPDLDLAIQKTLAAIQNTKETVGDTPIIIDSTATLRPVSMAKALIKYGFHVQAVFTGKIKETDIEAKHWLEENHPQVFFVQKNGINDILGYNLDNNCIAIGHDCAFLLQAKHYVSMFNDESFYGLNGIYKLMQLICKSFNKKITW